MPPDRSGIADYSAISCRRCGSGSTSSRSGGAAHRADVALYHVGNNPDAHGWIVDALRKRPGVVVLHDFVLHHLVSGITLGRRNGTPISTRSARPASSAGCSRTA